MALHIERVIEKYFFLSGNLFLLSHSPRIRVCFYFSCIKAGDSFAVVTSRLLYFIWGVYF